MAANTINNSQFTLKVRGITASLTHTMNKHTPNVHTIAAIKKDLPTIYATKKVS